MPKSTCCCGDKNVWSERVKSALYFKTWEEHRVAQNKAAFVFLGVLLILGLGLLLFGQFEGNLKPTAQEFCNILTFMFIGVPLLTLLVGLILLKHRRRR
jgi:hypothetical protein